MVDNGVTFNMIKQMGMISTLCDKHIVTSELYMITYYRVH